MLLRKFLMLRKQWEGWRGPQDVLCLGVTNSGWSQGGELKPDAVPHTGKAWVEYNSGTCWKSQVLWDDTEEVSFHDQSPLEGPVGLRHGKPQLCKPRINSSFTCLFLHLVATEGTTTYAAVSLAIEVYRIHASDLAHSLLHIEVILSFWINPQIFKL